MSHDLLEGGLSRETVELHENVRLAVLYEFIRPGDPFDRDLNFGVVEEFDDPAAEAVMDDVIFEGADDLGVACGTFDGFAVQRLDEAGIDECDGESSLLEQGLRFLGHAEESAEPDESDVRAFADDFRFAELDRIHHSVDRCAVDWAAWVADRRWAGFVVGHPFQHRDELRFIRGGHVDDAGDGSQVADVEESVVSRAVIAGEATTVHAKADWESLERHVMNDHVVGALHEGRIDCEERLVATGGHATCEERGVFFGDSDVVVALGELLLENFQLCPTRHRCGDGDQFLVCLRHVGDGAAEDVGAGRGGGDVGGSVFDLVGTEAVELARIIKGRLIPAALFGDDVENDGFVERFQVLEGLYEEG